MPPTVPRRRNFRSGRSSAQPDRSGHGASVAVEPEPSSWTLGYCGANVRQQQRIAIRAWSCRTAMDPNRLAAPGRSAPVLLRMEPHAAKSNESLRRRRGRVFLPFMLSGWMFGVAIGRAVGSVALGMAFGQAVGSILGAVAVFTRERRERNRPAGEGDGSS